MLPNGIGLMFKMSGMMSSMTDFNAKAPRREDAEKMENVLLVKFPNLQVISV